MATADVPSPMGVVQRRFGPATGQLIDQSASVETPSRFGPRHCGQSAAFSGVESNPSSTGTSSTNMHCLRMTSSFRLLDPWLYAERQQSPNLNKTAHSFPVSELILRPELGFAGSLDADRPLHRRQRLIARIDDFVTPRCPAVSANAGARNSDRTQELFQSYLLVSGKTSSGSTRRSEVAWLPLPHRHLRNKVSRD